MREKFDTSVEFDGSLEQVEFLATEYLERAALLVKHQALAMANLEIAQHRDKLRYAVTRSGAYLPRLFRFEVGDLVYIQREAKQATEPKTFPTVLVIVGFKDNGLAVLEGRDARQITVPVIRLAPCHLLNIDLTTDPALQNAREAENVPCEECKQIDSTNPGGEGELPERVMILCDACGKGWHVGCLRPRLTSLPEGDWVCERCKEEGLSAPARRVGEAAWSTPRLALDKKRDEEKRLLHGRTVAKLFKDDKTGEDRLFTGQVRYDGWAARPPFHIAYEDGDEESMTHAEVKRHLVRDEAVAALAAAASVGAAELQDLPARWEYTADGVREMLEKLMPGEWSPTAVSRIKNRLPGQSRFLQLEDQQRPGQPECVEMSAQEVKQLDKAVDLRLVGQAADPFSGTGTVKRVLAELGVQCIDCDINPLHHATHAKDSLQPGFLKHLQENLGVESFITSPPFAVLDLALPMLVSAGARMIAVHAPAHYVFDAHPRRAVYLARLQDEQRLVLVAGLEREP